MTHNHQIIYDALQSRYATKKFDSTLPLSSQDEKAIDESLRMSPSSF